MFHQMNDLVQIRVAHCVTVAANGILILTLVR